MPRKARQRHRFLFEQPADAAAYGRDATHASPRSGARIFRTASFRLAALYLLLFVASAMVLGSVVFWTTREALLDQLQTRVETELRELTNVYDYGGVTRLVAGVTIREKGPGALDYLVQDSEGIRLAGEIPAIGSRRGWLRLPIGVKETVLARTLELPGGVVVAVGDDLRRINDAEDAILSAFAWAVAATVLLGAGGGAWLSHLFLHRVDTIARTAEAIISGDLTRRVPLRGTGDDLDRLAGTLNHMLDRIGVLMDSVRHSSNNIAHDLRTPLSRLGQRLEDALAHACSVADYRHAMEKANDEVGTLLGTFAALLRIAEIESGAQRAEFCTVDLSLIAETVADAFTPPAEESGHDLTMDVMPGIRIHGDRELLTQMLVNLIENALRHTPPGTRMKLRLWENGGCTTLAVEDDGPGIPEAERENVVRRFYRLDQSRSTPGTGLGLSLVSSVAALHGAELRLTDCGPGLRASVVFPRSPV
jgi:signal transduction histidine kinase